uniref:Uncharacterized protein n=1 Tax=Zooxanthella nutricula TaxID=1333877 RepID=A0A7S2KYB5_9DINO
MAPPSGGGTGAARLLLLVAACVPAARGDSVVEILGQLKAMRDVASELFDSAAAGIKEAGDATEAEKVSKWSNDWLSVLGVQRGLTGLVKDFALNYLGRSSYHDANGELVDAISALSMRMRSHDALGDDEAAARVLRQYVMDICKAGKKVFASGGSLHTMLSELQAVLKDANIRHFAKGMKNSAQLRKVLEYLAGPRPADAAEPEEL